MTELAHYALRYAASQIGVREDPPGSNRGPKVDEYLRWAARAGLLDPMVLTEGRKGPPWCVAFALWCIAQGARIISEHARPQLVYSLSGRRLVELNQKLLLDRPTAGSIAIHINEDGTSHVQLVQSVTYDFDIKGIEGNTDASGSRTGGQVMEQKRPSGWAQAFLAIR